MNQNIIATFAFFVHSIIAFSQGVNTAKFTVTKDVFKLSEFVSAKESYYLWPTSSGIKYSYKDLVYNSDEGLPVTWLDDDREIQPCLVVYSISIPLKDNEDFVSFTIEEQMEELIYENLFITYILPSPIDDGADIFSRENLTYSKRTYPDENFFGFFVEDDEYEYNSEMSGNRKTLYFLFCPFRFDTVERNLYLLTDVTLNLTLRESGSDAINEVKGKTSVQDVTIFDLSGRRLNTVPAKGMYIRGGRKVLVK